MRLSYAVIYTPGQSQAKELETNVKYEVPGYSSKSACISRSNKQSALDPYDRRERCIPQILFADATIISALASNLAEYRSASVGCS